VWLESGADGEEMNTRALLSSRGSAGTEGVKINFKNTRVIVEKKLSPFFWLRIYLM